ncbi:MAG: type IV pilus modification PilV family protein [Pirellulales bacterium]
MPAPTIPHRLIPPAAQPRRAVISLLEVLVSCGILIVGLTSLAAVLPAAGARLAQATLEDRAGTLAENAYAEAISRGLTSRSLLVSDTQACVFGVMLENLVPDPPTKRGKGRKSNRTVSIDSRITATGTIPPTIYQRIDDDRGFYLEDELTFQMPTVTETPLNIFMNSGTNCPRDSKKAICWGAMLAPIAGTNEATLSIAIFRKEGDYTETPIMLTDEGFPLFSVEDDDLRDRYLKGCSFVLVLVPDTLPLWAQVASSWTGNVVLDVDPALVAGRSIAVIGFENLVRVDQYRVTLD